MKFGFLPLTSGAIALTTALALSGCHSPIPVQTTPVSSVKAPAAASMGTVTVDLAAMAKAGSARHVMGEGFRDATIVAYRLTASGPGMQPVSTAPVAWTPVVMPGLVAPPTDSITLQVPSGYYRMFTFEGLNANDEPVATMHTLSPVVEGGQTMLLFDWRIDAAARVFAEIADNLADDYPLNPLVQAVTNPSPLTATTIAQAQANPNGVDAIGANMNLVMNFVQACTGVDNTNLGFGGGYTNFAPGRFNAWKLANDMVQGLTFPMPTTGTPTGPTGLMVVPDAMDYETTITLHASLVDKAGNPATATSATLTLLDPIPAHANASFATEPAVITEVLPGTWRARVVIDGDGRIVTLKMPPTTARHIDGYVAIDRDGGSATYDVEPDADGDGYPVSRDVDDADASIHEASATGGSGGDGGILGADGP